MTTAPNIDWNWLIEANEQNPFSDEELAEMGTTREELDWHIGQAEWNPER